MNKPNDFNLYTSIIQSASTQNNLVLLLALTYGKGFGPSKKPRMPWYTVRNKHVIACVHAKIAPAYSGVLAHVSVGLVLGGNMTLHVYSRLELRCAAR